MKVYADTSVFGGVFDQEFAKPTRQFFAEIDAGRFTLVTSAIVEAEIEPAPDRIRDFFARYESIAEIVRVTQEALLLQRQYIDSGVVTPKSAEDALHVALATVSRCALIVSWNFKHIVHFDKIPKYNAVNTRSGYGQIGIYSPLEVIDYDSGDDART
uniref:PIN domain-containing protein n=1 Tax=Candidatus Kentrum sp. SD TaxID=2126332 RepID=A0A450Z754_9GAMM|nr:MAG: PIN domain-containing protein [Candidatus Kentron sp. SD]VFK49637.1 MAG: PIN domain-containing protein [Candidatus Kentron sp. SD]VFK80955.1 MAG: PIN domain-containing protein [Candidatus Kentron sp. SD]